MPAYHDHKLAQIEALKEDWLKGRRNAVKLAILNAGSAIEIAYLSAAVALSVDNTSLYKDHGEDFLTFMQPTKERKTK